MGQIHGWAGISFHGDGAQTPLRMLRPGFAPGKALLVLLAVLLLGPAARAANGRRQTDVPPARLAARIPVAPLGFRPPGALYMLTRQSFSTLNFIDSTHLLFTFHKFTLLKREKNSKPWDDDQAIQAMVLDLPSGEVQATATWRMSDRGRYLWPAGEGKFLVRQRNTYSLTDASLKLRGWIRSSERVAATEVSADGRLLVVESDIEVKGAEERRKLAQEAALTDTPPPAIATGITLVDIDSRTTRAQFRNELPIALPVTSTGFITVKEVKSNDYEVRFVPFQGRETLLGDVMSSCTPRETFLNSKAVLIQSCGPNSPDFYLNTWTIEGGNLWSGRRDGHHVWPTYATALNGSRFAVGVLDSRVYVNLLDSLTHDEVKQQLVQVYDTATGKLVFQTNASPILSAGQNFALSPDGSRFAVLRDGAIEVYDLPE